MSSAIVGKFFKGLGILSGGATIHYFADREDFNKFMFTVIDVTLLPLGLMSITQY
jgi:hypothetical protein